MLQGQPGKFQYAQNQPLTDERVRVQMEKLGNTPFEWERLDIQMDENIFIPMKTLNETRRQALEALEQELTKPFKRAEAPHVSLKTGQKNKKRTENLPIYVSCEDLDTARSLYKREGIRGMYLPFSVMEKCLEQGLEQDLEMYLATPHIMRGELPQGFLETAGKWLKQGMTGFLVRSLEAFAALKSAGWQTNVCWITACIPGMTGHLHSGRSRK